MLVKPRDVKWYGYRADLRDNRDKMFEAGAVAIPDVVDLRKFCPPVMNQGNLGSCTAHGITAALRYLLKKSGQRDRALSRLQLYYDERVVEGTVGEDGGAEIRNGIKCIAKNGVAHESLWKYSDDARRFKKKPTDRVYSDALKFQTLEYRRVPVTAGDLKAALASGVPVVIGFTVYESFESDEMARTGVMPMPADHEQVLGGHCALVVGYGQKPGYFTVQNSWDTDWADKGHYYMPEAFVQPWYCGDFWAITKVE